MTLIAGVHPTALVSFSVLCPPKAGPGPCVVVVACFVGFWPLFFFAAALAQSFFSSFALDAALCWRRGNKAGLFWTNSIVFFLFDFIFPYSLAASLTFFCGRGAIGRRVWLLRHHCCTYHTYSTRLDLCGEKELLQHRQIFG